MAGPGKKLVTTVDIQAMLDGEIAAGNLPKFTGNQLFIVFLPPGVSAQVIAADGQAARAPILSSGLAFHTWNSVKNYPYALMPFPNAQTQADTGFNAFNYLTELSSHELVEGITDPKVFYVNPTVSMGTGWFYLTTGFEIGDPLNGVWLQYPKEAGFISGPYIVQAYWTNFIQLSNYPHEWPLIGGNPNLPGVINAPIAIGRRPPVIVKPNPPGNAPPPRPAQPAPPTLPAPTPPMPPSHPGPAIPGGSSLVQPAIASSTFNPSDLAVASQNGLILSTNGGASWSSPIAFPTASSGGSSLVFDKKGNLYWSYFNPTTGGISIVTINPSTGRVSWYTNSSGQQNASGDYLLDTYATYSVDGGQSWSTPLAVDSQAFDPDAGAANVLNGTPPTTGIGNSFGVTIDGSTVFVANDANTYTGTTATGQQVAVESFLMPGTLFVPTNLGNNVITISQQSSNSGVDVVQINGVTVFSQRPASRITAFRAGRKTRRAT